MKKADFITKKGPKPKGPYSTGVIYGDTVYISGILPVDPETGEYVRSSIEDEAHRVFKNLQIILEELGGDLNDVLKVTLYLADINDFAAVNTIYAEYFGSCYPARTTIQAAKLPGDCRVEIDVIAAYSYPSK